MIHSLLAVACLEIRHVLGQKKSILLGLLLVLPIALAGLLRQFGVEMTNLAASGLIFYLLYPQTVCVLSPLLYGTSAFSREVEEKTLTYLFTRPAPRWGILLAKYTGFTACLSALATASLIGAFAVAGFPGGTGLFLGFWAASLAVLAAYGALFTLVGMLAPRRALGIGFAYAAVESAVSFIPASINTATIGYYARSLWVGTLSPFFTSFDRSSPEELGILKIAEAVGIATVPQAYGALLAFTALPLVIACLLAQFREYSVTETI